MARKVIIDCDPGHDDAIAILLAAKHLDILGITTVSGNQTIEKVTANALKVVELGGLTDIPVCRGAARPMVREPRHAGTIHGESGLDGHDFPEPTTEVDARSAVDFIVETVRREDGVTLIPTGPLTNVATALDAAPDIRSRIEHISLMGGSMDYGNITPAAEFNIFVDPEAAAIVFRSGIPITMCGLNLTRQADARPVEVERLLEIGNPVADAVADLVKFYQKSVKRVWAKMGAALHDPCAVAALIDPEIFEFQPMHVTVETRGEHTCGMTVCDQRFAHAGREASAVAQRAGAAAPNAMVATRIDRDMFFNMLFETLALYV